MRVCFFGTYREKYSRNKIVLASLRSAGIDVIECHETLWHGIEDRVNTVSGGWINPKFWLRVIKTYFRLLKKYQTVGNYDVLMVGYPGHFDVFLANWLRRKRNKPLAWDVLMSLNLIIKERQLEHKSSLIVKFIKSIEKKSLKQADLMFIESKHYADWFRSTYDMPQDQFTYLPLGVDLTTFNSDRCQTLRESNQRVSVFYYGGFLPSHGIDIILEAARVLLPDNDIQFEFAGIGPELAAARKNATDLSNVTFAGFLEKEELLDRICAADICLGVFGDTPQAMMTVQNKLFECLAMGKCVVSGESEAVREAFTPGQEIWLCERTADGLARAVRELAGQPQLRRNLGIAAAEKVRRDYGFQVLGLKLRTALEGLVNDRGETIDQMYHAGERNR